MIDKIRVELEEYLGEDFTRLSAERKEALIARYKGSKKTEIIYIWWFLSCHYAYVKRWGMFSILFLVLAALTVFLTVVQPSDQIIVRAVVITLAGLGFWWVLDLFRLNTILRRYNSAKARVLLDMLSKPDEKV